MYCLSTNSSVPFRMVDLGWLLVGARVGGKGSDLRLQETRWIPELCAAGAMVVLPQDQRRLPSGKPA